MRCSHFPCDNEGLYHTTVDVDSIVAEGWFCKEHLPKENDL
jgi:hypothetical protein